MSQMTQSHLDATGYGHVIQESRKAAGTLIELKYASFVMTTCLGALYRGETLPNHITTLIDDPELIDTAKQVAAKVLQDPDNMDFTFKPTPERIWPAFLAEAVTMRHLRDDNGALVDSSFALHGNPAINLTDRNNRHFSKQDIDLQIQAADLCRCIISPFINKCMDKIRGALDLEDEISIDTVIRVFDFNMEASVYPMSMPLDQWFLPVYEHLQEEDTLGEHRSCLTEPGYYH